MLRAELGLLTAILERAWLDYHDVGGFSHESNQSARRDARYWLFCRAITPWSCRWVCSELDIDYEWFISKLRHRPADVRPKEWRRGVLSDGQSTSVSENWIYA